MTRGKLKFDWSVYSARRNVTVAMLQQKGIVTDYKSYVSYCDSMSVKPMTESAFSAEFVQPTPVKTEHDRPTAATVTEAPALEATVWMAGVKDEPLPEVIQASKKKKTKEPTPESGS